MLKLLSLILLTSCATYAPKTYNQECGEKGMILKGVSANSGRGSAYSFQSNSHVTASYYGESISCEVPKTQEEMCYAVEYGESARPINEYNSSVGGKQLINGAG